VLNTCTASTGNLNPAYGFDDQTVFGGYRGLLNVDGANLPAGRQCATICNTAGGYNFFGLVNSGTTQVACYCGVKITAGSVFTPETNCVP
jgi:hypothetical protein